MTDIVYAFDLDAGVTVMAADSPAGDDWLGHHAVTIPNIDFPITLANAKAAGLQIEKLPQAPPDDHCAASSDVSAH